MGVLGSGQERPLRLFEVLARNRPSAVGRRSGTRSTQEQTPRVFTIPPRQRLSSPTRLAIRRWRVARGRIRIRIRIRIIARVLKPPHPCNTKERKRETHNKTLSIFFSSFFTHTSHNKYTTSHTYANNKARKNDERFFLLWLLVLPPKSERRRRITSAISSRCCCGRDEDDDKC